MRSPQIASIFVVRCGLGEHAGRASLYRPRATGRRKVQRTFVRQPLHFLTIAGSTTDACGWVRTMRVRTDFARPVTTLDDLHKRSLHGRRASSAQGHRALLALTRIRSRREPRRSSPRALRRRSSRGAARPRTGGSPAASPTRPGGRATRRRDRDRHVDSRRGARARSRSHARAGRGRLVQVRPRSRQLPAEHSRGRTGPQRPPSRALHARGHRAPPRSLREVRPSTRTGSSARMPTGTRSARRHCRSRTSSSRSSPRQGARTCSPSGRPAACSTSSDSATS
jgi:hypothetical protein